MLGSPPAAQRPTPRPTWPQPPPAHTNGLQGRYRAYPQVTGAVTTCFSSQPTSARLQPFPHKGSANGGIPVGIAVARQRVQQQSTPPPPLTVVTCEERSTNQMAGWPMAPPPSHWQIPGGSVDQNGLPIQQAAGPPMGLQLARDPITGQFLLLPAPASIESMQRTVVWPGGCGSGLPPPVQVMPQPLLLDRLVTLATPSADKRRTMDEPLTSVMVPCDFSKSSGLTMANRGGGNGSGGGGSGSGGLAVIHSLPGHPGTPAPHFLIHQMPQNNSLLLSAQLTAEQSVVISSSSHHHQLGPQEGAAPPGPPTQVVGPPAGLLQLISHTETTNSFVRSDINTVFPIAATPHHHHHHTHLPHPHHQQETIVIKGEMKSDLDEKLLQSDKATSPATELSLGSDMSGQLSSDEELKEVTPATVQDASNQTETPQPSDDDDLGEVIDQQPKLEIKQEYSDRDHEEEREEGEVVGVVLAPVPTTQEVLPLEMGPTVGVAPPESVEEKPKEEARMEVKEEDFIPPEPNEIGCEKEDAVLVVPDLSGLELLSNSIAQYEAKNETLSEEEDISPEEIPSVEVVTGKTKPVDVPEPSVEVEVTGESKQIGTAEDGSGALLGGLGLLCELAHQRFIEETRNRLLHQPPPVPEESVDIVEDVPKESTDTECEKVPNENSEWEIDRQFQGLQMFFKKERKGLMKITKRGPGRPKKSPSRMVKKARHPSTSPSSNEPPVLEPWCASPTHHSPRGSLLSPPTLTPHKRKSSSDSLSPTVDSDSSGSGSKPPPLSPMCPSSSKKRKVGRPKKRPEKPVQTETIVAKSIRCSKTIVGLILANQAKQDVPPKTNKIRPKLKAEAKIKSWCDEDELEWSPAKENNIVEPLDDTFDSVGTWPYKKKEKVTAPPKKLKTKVLTDKKPSKKPVKVLAPKLKRESTEKPVVDNLRPADSVPECTLSVEHLDSLPCRVLVVMGGLFYAGQLTEVTPPDLYGVTLDKERGHRPHILCREQILTDAILEIRCENLPLPSGTRLCAYWSQQYRCLYPGTVCSDTSADDKFVCVEFDDGDNGKINRDDIRLLPHSYPIIEYDPNPLLSLGKRKRHNSTNSSDSQVKMNEVTERVHHPEAIEQPAQIVLNKSEPIPEVPPKLELSDIPVEEPGPLEPPPLENVQDPVQDATSDSVESKMDTGEIEEEDKSREDSLPYLSSFESELERRRLKRRRKDKLKHRLSENGDIRRHKHKHKDGCKTRHKHKHKHRHRKHKHKHSKLLGGLGMVIENTAVQSTDPQSADDEDQSVQEVPISQTNKKSVKGKKWRDRQGSVESKSKMAAFLPARQLWGWSGKGIKRGKGLGARARRKIFYKAIQRGKETIMVGDCAVFLSTGRPDRPYIGRIESMWECWGSNMLVKVSWFYHPEETIGCPDQLPYPGALFESPHNDVNDVQTISHKCEVLSLESYKGRLLECPQLLETVYDNNDTYYLAGYYDPTNITLRLEPGIASK